MKSKDSSYKYLLSRAVEEPMEATFELGENIKDISSRARRPVALGILGILLFIAYLIPSIYDSFYQLIQGILSGVVYPEPLTQVVIFVFIMSITATTLVYLYQVHKFNTYLLARYSAVSELADAQPERGKGATKRKAEAPGAIKPPANPIFAMMDIVEESMHELPQFLRLIRFCAYFLSIIAIFILAVLIISLTGAGNLIFEFGFLEIVLGFLAFTLIILALLYLLDAERLFNFLEVRHNIIDSIRFREDIHIPEGKDPLSRLITYLGERDPYIRSTALDQKSTFRRNITLTGLSGAKHGFDAYFSGTNVLTAQSVCLGMPMGRFSVFIRVFKDDITQNDIVGLREAALDVCTKERAFPLRIIALQWVIKELADDVYEFVLDNPIQTKNILTHIEIISEDVDVYSFIPMISYGEKAG
jgi:hypothetical protein